MGGSLNNATDEEREAHNALAESEQKRGLEIEHAEQQDSIALIIHHDDILTEILLRLPMKALFRFKSVNKKWKVMLTTSSLMTKHYDHRLLMNRKNEGDGYGKRGDQWTEFLSWEPRAVLCHNFLTKEECEYLIHHSKPYMTRSRVTVVNSLIGEESSSRTSTGSSFGRGANDLIKAIEKRIADYTSIPVENGENLSILHYEVGQKFDPHYDGFSVEDSRYDRMATLLMYLSDVEEGGETTFPKAKGDFNGKKGGLVVKPKLGDALLFWTMLPNGTLDKTSLHGGSPVIKGDKWSCTKWMHVGEYINEF